MNDVVRRMQEITSIEWFGAPLSRHELPNRNCARDENKVAELRVGGGRGRDRDVAALLQPKTPGTPPATQAR